MGIYAYRAIDASGRVSRGRMPALSVGELEGQLRSAGMELLRARPVSGAGLFAGRVPRRELINMCFHLEQTLNAGLMVTDSLQDLVDGMQHATLRETLVAVLQALREGAPLSAALSAYPRVFDDVFVGLVRSGEESGRMGDVFGRLAASLRWQDELSAQVLKLAMYPLFTAVVLAGVVLFVLTYLVPQLSGFIRSMGGVLPMQTRLLLALSDFVVGHWLAMLAALPALPLLGLGVLRIGGEPMRRWLDGLKLRLPLFGPILHRIALSRFASLFGMLYEAGVPVLTAIRTGRDAIGNRVLARAIDVACERIEQGTAISEAFRGSSLFPSLMIRMLRVGETTGGIDAALRNVAYFYDREVREAIAKLQGMIEPMLTVAMGLVLGWLMMAVLGPVYDLLSRVRV